MEFRLETPGFYSEVQTMSNSVQFDADADIYGRGLQCNIMMIKT